MKKAPHSQWNKTNLTLMETKIKPYFVDELVRLVCSVKVMPVKIF